MYPADKQQSCHIARWISSAAQSDIVCMLLAARQEEDFLFSFFILSRMESVFFASLTSAYTPYFQPSEQISAECLTCTVRTGILPPIDQTSLVYFFRRRRTMSYFFHIKVFYFRLLSTLQVLIQW